jgi:hypothetical protein
MTNVLSSALIAIAIPVVFWWLARKYPAPQRLEEGPSLEELRLKYRKWDWIIVLAYVALWFPVSAAIYGPLHFVARWQAQAMQEHVDTIVFFMDGAALWVPAFFMALLLSSVILTPALKAVLKARYAEYERYTALRYGFDQNRVMKGLVIFICAGFVVAVFAFFDAYVVASPGELRVNPLLGLERRYAYSEISEVLTAPALIAPNGNVVHRREFLLKFKDGTIYSTINMPEYEIGNRSPFDLIQAINQRSGVSTKEKAVFERGEL